jgi:hypothetical protein
LTSKLPLACRPFTICPLCRESTTSIAPFSVWNTSLLIFRVVANLSPADIDSAIQRRLGKSPPFGGHPLSECTEEHLDVRCTRRILSIIAAAMRKLGRIHQLPKEEAYLRLGSWKEWAIRHGMVLQRHIERYIEFKHSAAQLALVKGSNPVAVEREHRRAAQEAVQMARIFLREVQVGGS